MNKDILKNLSIDSMGNGDATDLLSGRSSYLLKPHTTDIPGLDDAASATESPEKSSDPQLDFSNIIPENQPNQSNSDNSFDLDALKLDSIVAEPDFGRNEVLNQSASEPSSSSSESSETPAFAGLSADNLQLDRRPASVSAPSQHTVSPQPSLPIRTTDHSEIHDYSDNSGWRQYIKLIVIAVLVLGIGGFIGYNRYHHYKITQKHDQPMADYDFNLSYLENFGALPMQGNPDALVTLSVFCDFQCPYCPKIGEEVDKLLEKYDGDLRVVWVNFPLPFHIMAFPAAHMATVAYSQGKYWEMKDELYSHQQEMNKNPNYFTEAAERVGLDIDDMKSVLENPDLVEELRDAINTGKSLGVGGTPAMVINKYVMPPQNKQLSMDLIDYELERARQIHKETGLRGDELFRELIDTAPPVVNIGIYEINFGQMWE